MAEIVIVFVGYFLFCFGAAWILARDQITVPLRNRLEALIRARTYLLSDRRYLGAQLVYLLSCVECQSFWFGLFFAWVPCGVAATHVPDEWERWIRGPIGWLVAAIALRGVVAIVYRRLFRVIGD